MLYDDLQFAYVSALLLTRFYWLNATMYLSTFLLLGVEFQSAGTNRSPFFFMNQQQASSGFIDGFVYISGDHQHKQLIYWETYYLKCSLRREFFIEKSY